MTHAEFAKGWTLLILQPWGWRYRGMTDNGKPTEESKMQLEFYYDKLKWAHPEAWWKVASMIAEGTEWPSISALRQSLTYINRQYVTAITDSRADDLIPMPDEFREQLTRLGVRQKDLTPTSEHVRHI